MAHMAAGTRPVSRHRNGLQLLRLWPRCCPSLPEHHHPLSPYSWPSHPVHAASHTCCGLVPPPGSGCMTLHVHQLPPQACPSLSPQNARCGPGGETRQACVSDMAAPLTGLLPCLPRPGALGGFPGQWAQPACLWLDLGTVDGRDCLLLAGEASGPPAEHTLLSLGHRPSPDHQGSPQVVLEFQILK